MATETASAICLVCSAENPPAATVCGTCGAALSGDPGRGFSTALPTGTRLKGEHYAVGKVLGQGGFGITYLGSDAHTRRLVAIKEFFPYGSLRQGVQVRPGGGLSPGDFSAAREKFFDEARILARFNHPGIVDVFDAFEENDTAYMVMEFLRGRSLGELLGERTALPEREAVDYITRAGNALEEVHRAGLLHRDIKPDNIMVTEDGRVVLIDFGTARTFAAGMSRRMTTMVTPGYAPLEQYGERVRFGAFTDVYALAATLYHLLTGQMPAPATDRASGVELQPPRRVNPGVSEGVSEAVMWALQMRVDRRPPTVRAFLDALAAATAPPEQPREVGPKPVSPSSAPPWLPLPLGEGPYYVDVAGEHLRWPNQCACCLAPPEGHWLVQHTGAAGPFGVFEETRGWDVPYCSACLEHVDVEATHSANGTSGLAAAAPLAGLVLGGPVGLLIGLGGAAAASLMKAAKRESDLQERLKATCVAVGPAVGYGGWYDNTHAFTFLNRGYAEAFARENAAQIVS